VTPVLACTSLSKTYGQGQLAEQALSEVTLAFEPGQTCVLLGPSGSGKTTLLSILGCLLTPSSGEVSIEGATVDLNSRRKLQNLRRTKIGFVFQQAHLLPFLNAEGNLRAVARNAGLSHAQSAARIAELGERLNIGAYLHRKPGELSGGQRQRVAIARALLHRPPIILADEPTSALDWQNGQLATDLLIEQAIAARAVLVTVTHDTRLLDRFQRVLRVDCGRVYEP
jgi:putative ABC transport system ATP-binding protein